MTAAREGPAVGTDTQDEVARATTAALPGNDAAKWWTKMPVRQRLQLLLDPGSWVEDGLLADAASDGLPADGVLTGVGTIEGPVGRGHRSRFHGQGRLVGGANHARSRSASWSAPTATCCRSSISSTRPAGGSPTSSVSIPPPRRRTHSSTCRTPPQFAPRRGRPWPRPRATARSRRLRRAQW